MKTLFFRLVNAFCIGMFLLFPLSSARAADPAPKPAQVSPNLRNDMPVIAGQQPAALHPASIQPGFYNTNLIPDGDAEVEYSNYWVDNEGFTQIKAYGADCGGNCNYPSPYDPGPPQRGNNFYMMGITTNHTNGTNMWIKNKISLASIQASVNTGRVRYILSGYFGGEINNTNSAQLHLFFEPASGPNMGEPIVGNVTPAERQNKTGLLYRQKTGFIPKGTVNINMVLQSGTINQDPIRTGYADNLSLVLLPIQSDLPIMVYNSTQLPSKTGYPAPSGLSILPNGLSRMNIYWTDNSTNELGFEVQRINPDSSVDTICNTKPNVTQCLDPGISQGAAYGYIYLGSHKTYTYQVRAKGPGINSAWVSASGTTATQPTSPPSATQGTFTCQSLDTTSSSTTFVWNDPFNYESGFNIYANGSSFPNWSMLEGGTKISFINQNPGTIQLKIVPFVYDRSNPSLVYESATSCTATAVLPSPPSNTTITYFTDNASYPVISLVVDGIEQFPVRPLGILSGAYYELDGEPSGSHSWSAVTGFWDDYGQRFEMYHYSGVFNQPSGGNASISIPDMSLQNLLSVPPNNLGYWEGYFFDANINCHTAAFKFAQNGTYSFYVSNSQTDSGPYSLVQREPAIFSTKFQVTDSGGSVQGLLLETEGMFDMKNGPASWPQITYVFKPQGYTYNPFCP